MSYCEPHVDRTTPTHEDCRKSKESRHSEIKVTLSVAESLETMEHFSPEHTPDMRKQEDCTAELILPQRHEVQMWKLVKCKGNSETRGPSVVPRDVLSGAQCLTVLLYDE
jgi:hypothetical protein